MNNANKKKLAALIMGVGVAGFFISFAHFHLFGSTINYTDTAEVLEMGCSFAFLVLGLFFGMYLYAGRSFAVRAAGSITAFLLFSYVLGLLLHR